MKLSLPVHSSPGKDASTLWFVQLQLLTLAKNTLGPRDTSKTIFQPVFSDDGPRVRNTPNLDGAFAELIRNAEGYWPTLINELAHETVHLLNPKAGGANWLEEGIAVCFSVYAQRTFGLEPQSTDIQAYPRSLELVSELPPDPLAAGRRTRDACGALDNATQCILESLFPSVKAETLTELSQPFKRDWSDESA